MSNYEMKDVAWMRLVDANVNRAAEGVRVIEDIARFVLSDASASRTLKEIRHTMGLVGRGAGLAISRKSARDVGRRVTPPSESRRGSWADILAANAKRVGESLRVLEETMKLEDAKLAKKIKEARYQLYDVEAELSRRFSIHNKLDFDLYVVTNREAQKGRGNVEVVRQAIRGGIRCVQLRDKLAPMSQYYRDAKRIAALCERHGVTFIVNDHIDICRAVDADGVHLGQEDIPVEVARKILGPDKILGYSTHSEREAKAAERGGADYVSVGPIFVTPSKEGWKPRGLRFVRWAKKNLQIPFVAIGGIDSYNVKQVVRAGARRVAVIRAVVGATDIAKATRELRRRIHK